MDQFLEKFINDYGYRFIPHCCSKSAFIDILNRGETDFVSDTMLAVAIEEQCEEAMISILESFVPNSNATLAFTNASVYCPQFLENMLNAGWSSDIEKVSARLNDTSMDELEIAFSRLTIS